MHTAHAYYVTTSDGCLQLH